MTIPITKGGDLWSEDYLEVSKWMEAQTDRLDYDLRGWEPVEYENLRNLYVKGH
ncbi:hypothetical protein BY996DRAFT_6535030 [Phakopsora pachyrhizi]|nr:hypothetical protein BY996DRAFT_6535030 [Phakopsora pachyrhizi]